MMQRYDFDRGLLVRDDAHGRWIRHDDAQAEIARLTAENERWQKNSIETWQAMRTMRDAINEYVPMPSLESDLLEGPENSVFCKAVSDAVTRAKLMTATGAPQATPQGQGAGQVAAASASTAEARRVAARGLRASLCSKYAATVHQEPARGMRLVHEGDSTTGIMLIHIHLCSFESMVYVRGIMPTIEESLDGLFLKEVVRPWVRRLLECGFQQK